MKSKCFHCHRLRINDSKINVFVNTLKLVKAGEILGSHRIKNYFFSLAKDVSSFEKEKNDPKKIAKIKDFIVKLTGQKNRAMSDESIKDQLNHMQRRYNIEKEKFEHEIMQQLEDIQANEEPEVTNQVLRSGQTSIIQKF